MKKSDMIYPVLAAAIFNKENRVLLAQRKEHLTRGLKWEFPGGKLNAGEDLESCLKREIFEELGIIITIRHVFTAVNHSYPDKNILLLTYICDYLSGDPIFTDHQKIKWIPVNELLSFDLSEADYPVSEKLIKDYSR